MPLVLSEVPRFSVQLQFSEVLVKWRSFFNFLAAQQGKSDMMVLEQKLELEQLKVPPPPLTPHLPSCLLSHSCHTFSDQINVKQQVYMYLSFIPYMCVDIHLYI